jgi:hypothetical protein
MCLTAGYWARISRVVFGATSYGVATHGFEDLQLYRELARPSDHRSLREDEADQGFGRQAAEVLRSWAEQFPRTRRTQVLASAAFAAFARCRPLVADLAAHRVSDIVVPDGCHDHRGDDFGQLDVGGPDRGCVAGHPQVQG